MKKLLLLGIMLLGLGGTSFARELDKKITFEEALTLSGDFVIVQDGKVLCGPLSPSDGSLTFQAPTDIDNYAYTFKFEEDADHAGSYFLHLYNQDGASKGYVNASIWSHTFLSNVDKAGNKGEKQDGALWTITAAGEKLYTIRNLGVAEGYYNNQPNSGDGDRTSQGYLAFVTSGYWNNHATHYNTSGTWEFYTLKPQISITLRNSENLIEIPQEQDLSGGGDAAAKDVSDGITTYTTVGGICVVFKMQNVNVKDYDYILFKFAEPVPGGLSYSFWDGTASKDLPTGVKEFKYVFADDAGCKINSEGIIPQISIITIFKDAGKIVKVAGVYGHKASGEAGTRTFSFDKALDFTDVEGLKAYAITGFNPANATLTLTQVYKVPANTGLYLEGADGEYQVPFIESASAIAGNMLVASGDGTITQTSGDKTNLVLAKTSKGRGFHPLSSDGNMGTNKAYLQLPTSEFNSIGEASLRFVFEDEEATGIAEVATPIVADGAWYTINGVKLAGEPTEKGIYIFNGKKVAIQ